jgi:hypothetical protein
MSSLPTAEAPSSFRFVPCVDGSELARDIFTFAELVGAAMCSACLRGSHDHTKRQTFSSLAVKRLLAPSL